MELGAQDCWEQGWLDKEEGLTQGWGTSGDKAQEWGSHHRGPWPSCRLHSGSPQPFSVVKTTRGKCWVPVFFPSEGRLVVSDSVARWTIQSMEFSGPAYWSG